MSGHSGRVIKAKAVKTPKQSLLDSATNSGENWWTPSQEQQQQDPNAKNDEVLKQYLPELFQQGQDAQPQQPTIADQLNQLRNGFYSNFNVETPDATATPTTSPINVWNKNIDNISSYYKDLPLYDNPSTRNNELRPQSQEEFQKYAKEKVRQEIIGQTKQAGGLGADLSMSTLQEVVNNTATASFLKMMGQPLTDLPTNVEYDKAGNVLYHGVKLNLSDDEKQILNDFNTERTTYHGENDSLLKQAAMLTATLAIDMPLYIATGSIAGATVSKIPFLAESAAANSVIGRLAGTFAVNDLMFNAVNLPRTIAIATGQEQGNILDEIWGNTKFAAGATIAGSVGVGISRMGQTFFRGGDSAIAQLLDKFPGVSQELSGMISSFGLGTLFPSDVDKNGQITSNDRLATGLSFAAMHFANPNGFKEFAKEMKNRNIMMENQNVGAVRSLVEQGMPIEEAIKVTRLSDDNYYELKDNKLIPINTDELVNNGSISYKDGANPIDYSADNKKNYTRINQIEPSLTRTLRDNLQINRINDLATDIYGRITTNLDPQYVTDNQNLLKQISWTVATSTEIGKVAEGFRKNRLPDDNTLNNKLVDLSNNWRLPFSDVKKYVIDRLPAYFANPEDFQAQITEANPLVAKDLSNLMDIAAKSIIKQSQQLQVKDFMNSLTTQSKLLMPATGEESNIDLQNAAESVKRQLDVQKAAQGTIIPPTKNISFYDFKGELLPIEIKGKTATILGTDVQLDVSSIKDKIKTAKEVKAEKKAVTQSTITENEFVNKAVEDYRQKQLALGINPTPDELLKVVKQAKVDYGQESVDKSKNKENNVGGSERQASPAEPSSGNSGINVESKTPSGTVNEQTQGEIKSNTALKSTENAIEAQGSTNIEKPIQSTDKNNIEAPNAPNKAVFEDKFPTVQNTARELADIVRTTKTGYKTPEITEKLDKVFEDANTIVKTINDQTPSAKVRTDQLVSHLLKAQGLNDKQIAGLIATQTGKFVTDKNVADYRRSKGGQFLNENFADKFKPQQVETTTISPADAAQAGLSSTTIETTAPKKSETTEALPGAILDMRKNRLDPTSRNDIKEASDLGIIDDMQRSALLKNIKRSEQDVVGKDQTEYSQRLDALLKSGKITQEQYDKAKNILFETNNPQLATLSHNPEDRITIENDLKSIFPNAQIGWDAILPEGKTARTYIDEKGNPHIDFTNLASVNAPIEEQIHAQALLATDQPTLNKVLKEIYPTYDGIEGSDSWRAAHEKLAENAMNSKQDKYGVVSKIRETWEKLKNFFSGNGWHSTSEWYRKLLNGKVDIGQAKESTPSLFETRSTNVDMNNNSPDKHAEQLDELGFDFAEWNYNRKLPATGADRIEKLHNNVLVRKAIGMADGLYKAALQNRNTADQIKSDGMLRNPYTHSVYHQLEDKVILKVNEQVNRLLESPTGWNLGKDFRSITPDEQTLLTSKIRQYETDIADKKREPLPPQDIAKGESFDSFMNRVATGLGLTDKEKVILSHTQQSARETQDLRRTGYADFIRKDMVGEDGKSIIADGLSIKQLKDTFGDKLDYTQNETDLYKKANELLGSDSGLMDNVVNKLVDMYAPKYYNFYYNDVRPSDPKFYSIQGKRPLDSNGNLATRPEDIAEWQPFNSYGTSEKEAKQIANEYVAQGFSIDTFDKIGDLITKEQFDKLTANQLMNLVDSGHIDPSHPVIKALLNATKTGNYEQHNINKKYIKGMHYTPIELESGVQSLIKESVGASTKRFGLAEIRGQIAKSRADLNALLKSPGINPYDKDRMRRDFDYSVKIYNQVSKSDQSFVDAWRQGATAFYIGVKPSFWFQQMMQPLQNALPEAIAESRNTTINGTKAWSNGFSNALELGRYIRAEKLGEKINTSLSQEFIDLYHKMDAQNLMGAVGIEELSGKGKDIQMRYGSDLYKGWNKMLKLANMGGAVAEKFTRIQALSTFYDIGKAKGLEGTALEEYLVKHVKNVMGGWGALDRPAIFQSKQLGKSQQKILKAIDKAFFTFKTYSNSNLGQYDRLFRTQALGSAGTKAIIGVGMHGITKFPLAATIFAIANLFMKDDSEYETLKLVDELDSKIGGHFGSIISKGLLSQGGINLQNLFDERSSFATDVYSQTRSDSVEGKLAEAMFGAPYGLAKDVITGSTALTKLVGNNITNDGLMTQDEKDRALKNLNKLTPLFVRNVLTAMSLDKDGVQLKGKQIVKSDDITWGDIVYKVLGFNLSKVNDAYEYQFNGTPAKLTRTKGTITELKKIRKDIMSSPNYDASTRASQLRILAQKLRESMAEEAVLTKQLNVEKRQKSY